MSNKSRPLITAIKPEVLLEYNQNIAIEFELRVGDNHDHAHVGDNIYVTMAAPSLTTLSFALNQRLLILALDGPVRMIGSWNHVVRGHAPASGATRTLSIVCGRYS
ncbi:hypothetical protein Dsin_014330 [Dipteronia sinensis]|uniref:Galactose oxidase-like Early set domain-containing protein n=1 Tax=Dipteronia sinensis TaxID=43782 RepID=A0AAE0EBG7_9ROSI|nr:hypothetical protein Dsin_014330 [Dipteronia sinensis]